MICARHPQRGIALHPLKPNDGVLHHIIQRMAHMQLPGNIRRGHHNGKGFFTLIHLGMKISFFHPLPVQPFLNR